MCFLPPPFLTTLAAALKGAVKPLANSEAHFAGLENRGVILYGRGRYRILLFLGQVLLHEDETQHPVPLSTIRCAGEVGVDVAIGAQGGTM